ncbi:MAG TPA: erythromycin esterase family protein [Chloroflexia bacterium]|nr:erythromycin esterase family protein [Chloroflexia bacterium]
MADRLTENLIATVRQMAQPMRGEPADYDSILEQVGDAQVVLIGEASHGTHEFYQTRAEITRRLITEKGFQAVAVEADWPDAYRVNCYVRGATNITNVNEALSGFKRFPQWMWRNTVVVEFLKWLRQHNTGLPQNATKTGFYGLDLYSLFSSIQAVIQYLDKVDPEAAKKARERYACFEHYGEDPQRYGYTVSFNVEESCQREVLNQLVELQKKAAQYKSGDGRMAQDEYFYAQQNARLAKNAEEYYRSMFEGRVSSWNLRDCHMADTLNALVAHLTGQNQGQPAKVVVWAHNSHLGNAKATEMGTAGELNVGQVVRERYDGEMVSIGFTTYSGTVSAAYDWDEPVERRRVRPGLADSYEKLFHETGLPAFILNLRDNETLKAHLGKPRLERAIGVIYRPETERFSHYFYARLPEQFDTVIHIDETRALEPLERTPQWENAEAPETFPSSL